MATVLERLMAMVIPEPMSGCWLFIGADSGNGYGRMRVDGKSIGAHRLSYILHVGPIPEDKELDHLCRVRCCVNPKHLEPVLPIENYRRGMCQSVAGAFQRAITNCPAGHPYDEKNTRTTPTGGRRCRACHRLWENERYRNKQKILSERASLSIP